MPNELKEKILSEMLVDYRNALDKNFELAKNLIKITPEGKIDIPIKSKLTGKEQVLLYLIGKMYAKEAELISSEEVNNQEIMNELGIPEGSLYPWIKSLREDGKIKSVKPDTHTVPLNLVEKSLKEIFEKVRVETDDN